MTEITKPGGMPPRRVTVTPEADDDLVLHAFLASLDPESDIDAYAHSSEPTLRIAPCPKVVPAEQVMDDGRLVYVFRMGRLRPHLREYIVVVTSSISRPIINEKPQARVIQAG